MEKRFNWKAFVQYSLDNCEYKSFEDFATEMHDCIDWVAVCDGRTEEDILNHTIFVMFDGWFK